MSIVILLTDFALLKCSTVAARRQKHLGQFKSVPLCLICLVPFLMTSSWYSVLPLTDWLSLRDTHTEYRADVGGKTNKKLTLSLNNLRKYFLLWWKHFFISYKSIQAPGKILLLNYIKIEHIVELIVDDTLVWFS